MMSSRHQLIISSQRRFEPMSAAMLRFASYHSTTISTSDHQKKNPSMSTKDYRYCVELVKNRDRESYLCGLLMPYNARRSFFGIRAWNAELASIKGGSVLNRNKGEQANAALQVRIQWWREGLNKIYDSQQQSENNHEKTINATIFRTTIRGTRTDLHDEQPETITDMVEYADNIVSSLLYLTLETVNVRDEAVDVVAQHAGIGIGLATALRGVRFRLARGECSIPKEFFPEEFPYHKLMHTNNNTDQLKDAVKRVCILAYSHLSKAQELQSTVPKHARMCFLPIIPALHYLSKLENAKYDIFDERLLEHDNLKILALLGRTWLTGVF
ncbi:phytoene synthase [Fragilariopsis cylindrus CCMP1102]|uniref:Phytoene synthase n=1 Tax=Fragilariopsis cylindrus CCMP1102 TaxID=635003 RepID=A0A1E7EIX3_9STRA|nr:phytoene synthase [Fragilariopsis cylindrus CCMP1102]|eukprot:OEU05837.1 phytoene synthase [Fragilariopsis cylindrus CCMP1102]